MNLLLLMLYSDSSWFIDDKKCILACEVFIFIDFLMSSLPLCPSTDLHFRIKQTAFLLKTKLTHLVHTVEELQEDGGEAAALACQRLSSTVAESVSERQPLLLHQQPEPVEGSVVGV